LYVAGIDSDLNPAIIEALAAIAVLAAVAYVAWFFYDYARNGDDNPFN
jgi:hypothetical protein